MKKTGIPLFLLIFFLFTGTVHAEDTHTTYTPPISLWKTTTVNQLQQHMQEIREHMQPGAITSQSMLATSPASIPPSPSVSPTLITAPSISPSVQPTQSVTENPGNAQSIFDQLATTSTDINSSNAAQMQLGWSVKTSDPVSGTPLIDQRANRAYITDWGGNVYAIDTTNGNTVWKKHLEDPQTDWPWHGLAATGVLANNTLYETSVEGNLYAINPADGSVKWSVPITKQQYAGVLAAPLYYNGVLYVGLSSVDEPLSKQKPDTKLNFQGHVKAFNANTGQVIWDLPLVQAPNNGIAVWGGFALDPTTNTLFFATGNNYTDTATDLSDSAMAVDAGTGTIKWHYQAFTHDIWVADKKIGPDWDFGAPPQLFDATINGSTRHLVGFASKSAIYFVFDRDTGQLVWKTVVGYPATGGGIRWGASIGNNVVYITSNNNYEDKDPSQHPITVSALDAGTGKILWQKDKVQSAKGSNSDFLANDVFFVGTLDGSVNAYSTADGSVIASWKLPTSVTSSLNVVGNTIYIGGGIPSQFGGSSSENGLYTLTLKK